MPNSEESRQRSHKATLQQVAAKSWTGQPYPAYKDSGVEWLGEVPEHWDVVPVKRGYDIRLGKMLQTKANSDDDVEVSYLKAKDVQWFSVQPISGARMWASPGDVEQFSVSSGDLLVCEGGEGGRCGILTDQVNGHIIQNSLHRVRSRYGNSNIFLQYAMRAVAEMGWFAALNNKATIAHFTYEKFGALHIPLPSPSEQRAIAHFLDDANKRIQRYIHAKEKLIKLLEEQKQVIIYQAVTGQIDVRIGQPYPAYKDSGVEWLGEVPQSWRIFRLKGVVANVADLTKELDGDNIYLALEHVESWTGKFSIMNDSIDFDSQAKRFQSGDVLFGKLRPYLAKVVCPGRDGICAGEFLVLRSHYAGLLPKYFEQLLRSKPVISAIDASTFGAKMPRADWQFIGNMRIPLPPLSEQQAIARFLTDTCQRISAACAAVKREIELLHEYRTRLIADVVTGKLDVREAAAALPEKESPTGGDNCQDGMAFAVQVQSRCP